jgi:hypothetical protein
MLVNDVIRQAETLSDETYDVTVWIDFINEALDDLTPFARLYKEVDNIVVSLDSKGFGFIDITSHPQLSTAYEIISVYADGKKLRKLPPNDDISRGFKIGGDKIIIQHFPTNIFTCRVGYYDSLKHVAGVYDNLENVSGLPEKFHYAVVVFCAAKAKQREEDLNEMAGFWNEYNTLKQMFVLERMRMVEPHRMKYSIGKADTKRK